MPWERVFGEVVERRNVAPVLADVRQDALERPPRRFAPQPEVRRLVRPESGASERGGLPSRGDLIDEIEEVLARGSDRVGSSRVNVVEGE